MCFFWPGEAYLVGKAFQEAGEVYRKNYQMGYVKYIKWTSKYIKSLDLLNSHRIWPHRCPGEAVKISPKGDPWIPRAPCHPLHMRAAGHPRNTPLKRPKRGEQGNSPVKMEVSSLANHGKIWGNPVAMGIFHCHV